MSIDLDSAQIDVYARRVMNAQDIRMGPLTDRADGPHPIDPKVVTAVLRALADHTHNAHMVKVIVDQQALCDESSFEPRVTSLGRYFHRLADAIEDQAMEAAL